MRQEVRLCDQTEVNNKDDDREKRDRKERNNRESGRGKSQQGDEKRRSYSAAVIEGALRTERVFMGDPILRKTDRTLSKGRSHFLLHLYYADSEIQLWD